MEVIDLGRIGYAEAMHLQDSIVDARLREEISDTLVLLEHPPVITVGRRGSAQDILVPEATLARMGIEVHPTTRGGLVTYHGPGQLVGYPVVIEQAIIVALAEIGVEAHIEEQHVGVWTAAGKIAAIGVAQRHGVTLHGFAVNLQPDLSHFNLINPCGIGQLGVTSAASILGRPVDVAAFKTAIGRALEAQLAPVARLQPA